MKKKPLKTETKKAPAPGSLPPTVLTIFGATGDLSARYLLPALYHMDMEGLLPDSFQLVCVGRKDLDKGSFLDFVVKKSKALKELSKPDKRRHFLRHLTYFKGDFDDPASFKPLSRLLADREEPRHECFNRLYYFATSPQYFASVTRILKESGLLMSCQSHERKVRILVEKPFGFNQQSAKALNKLLLKFFTEDQIYRIDHYQGKETVQNLMVVRFANRLFEPLWNREHIDHVEISVLEQEGVGGRSVFYNEAGALKDMVQNHMLQMLALLAMNEPYELTAEHIRNEKIKILKSLEPLNKKQAAQSVIKGQYKSYVKETGQESGAETFVALKALVNTPRWKGVPFYLRTGKGLARRVTEISVHFKELKRCLFVGCAANVLTFRIQPDESVHLQINNKIPGSGVNLKRANLEFGYSKAFMTHLPSAYERLLLDFMQGDQRLFIRSDEIEAAWKFVDSVAENWKNLPLNMYDSGSSGPKEAEEFIGKDLREWWTK